MWGWGEGVIVSQVLYTHSFKVAADSWQKRKTFTPGFAYSLTDLQKTVDLNSFTWKTAKVFFAEFMCLALNMLSSKLPLISNILSL